MLRAGGGSLWSRRSPLAAAALVASLLFLAKVAASSSSSGPAAGLLKTSCAAFGSVDGLIPGMALGMWAVSRCELCRSWIARYNVTVGTAAAEVSSWGSFPANDSRRNGSWAALGCGRLLANNSSALPPQPSPGAWLGVMMAVHLPRKGFGS
ncbi:hypothetical protein HYH03_017321 [Edaphochlamys debaryana]|uniref:Uncharacterized protein n=1 Tax=Edaphochlamys debaryana TaxID=47281 RepID=A0A835XGS0_9CHLO|nr:hypothetical protein HYH03_017321 [Edaphochlamys debaryana]|eukprot:KAG2483798.1 hypothetical protein HYH03_017321 [Edaphochlamys debaryana]